MFDYLPLGVKIYLYILAFVVGAFLGSGLNCLAYRMAREQKWSSGRSVCPECGHTLTLVDLIPVVSWVALRGKCRHCGGKISPRYVLAEVGLGVCFASLLWRFGLTLDTVSAVVLCACLFALSLVDLDIQIIPDRFLVIPAVVRIVQLAVEGNLMSGILPGLVFGGGLLTLSLVMDKILKKDTMGGGDIKLMAVLGLFFGWGECLFLLVVACVAGIVIASVLMKVSEDTPFPFGPALSLAAWVTMLVGTPFINWYLGLF